MKIKLLIITIIIFLGFSFSNALAASANFSLSGGGNVSTSQNVTLTLSVNSSSAYNSVNATVTFSNLTYVSASASSNWIPVSGPSRSGNSVSFSGAVLGNSYTGTRTVMTITLKTLSSAGSGTVTGSGSIALADGNGTQVSGSGSTVKYTASAPTAAPKPIPNAVVVSSSTHPDTNKWYTLKDAEVSWNKQDGVTDFSYSIDQKSDTAPDDTSEGGLTTKSLTGLLEGKNYFHIKAKNDSGWGTVSHFPLNVDLSKPDPFTITYTRDETSSSYILYFATNDNVSGTEKYMVQLDNNDVGEQKSGYKIDTTVTNVLVTAYDKAGNSVTSNLNLIQTTPAPVITTQTETVPTSSNNIWGAVFLITTIILLIYAAGLTAFSWKKLGLKDNIPTKPVIANK